MADLVCKFVPDNSLIFQQVEPGRSAAVVTLDEIHNDVIICYVTRTTSGRLHIHGFSVVEDTRIGAIRNQIRQTMNVDVVIIDRSQVK